MKHSVLTAVAFFAACIFLPCDARSETSPDPITISPLNDHLYLITCTAGSEL